MKTETKNEAQVELMRVICMCVGTKLKNKAYCENVGFVRLVYRKITIQQRVPDTKHIHAEDWLSSTILWQLRCHVFASPPLESYRRLVA